MESEGKIVRASSSSGPPKNRAESRRGDAFATIPRPSRLRVMLVSMLLGGDGATGAWMYLRGLLSFESPLVKYSLPGIPDTAAQRAL